MALPVFGPGNEPADGRIASDRSGKKDPPRGFVSNANGAPGARSLSRTVFGKHPTSGSAVVQVESVSYCPSCPYRMPWARKGIIFDGFCSLNVSNPCSYKPEAHSASVKTNIPKAKHVGTKPENRGGWLLSAEWSHAIEPHCVQLPWPEPATTRGRRRQFRRLYKLFLER